MDHKLSILIFMPFFILYFVIRGYWSSKALKRPVQEDKSFFLDKVNIGMMNFALLIFPLLALFTHWLDFADYPENEALIYSSIPFLIAGLVTIWLSHRDLGENWSVTLELKENHTLVTNGIFRRVRHPMYLSIWLCAIGQALAIPNYLGGASVMFVWGLLYFVRIEKEEKMMIEKFGNAYSEYAKRTKRLIPL